MFLCKRLNIKETCLDNAEGCDQNERIATLTREIYYKMFESKIDDDLLIDLLIKIRDQENGNRLSPRVELALANLPAFGIV
jgi:hypothetical protein